MFSKANRIFGAVIVAATMAAINPTLAVPVNGTGNVTSHVIYGSGNSNGSWTGTTQNNIEIGLRGKIPFVGTNNYNGVDSYSFDAGFKPGSTYRPTWNFDWAINVNQDGTSNSGRHIGDLTYMLSMDFDPTGGTNFSGSAFDPIHSLPLFDHSFGNNNTTQGQGVEATSVVEYAGLLAGSNIVQQSWSYGFFLSMLPGFDPNAAGIYTIMLGAFDGQRELASTSINIIVSAVPVPAALPLFGTGIAFMGFVGWRRRKAAAKNITA
ncbi:MAG: PEP-CTERM sorting domain-containing protein [Rhizobiaceae bacterium]